MIKLIVYGYVAKVYSSRNLEAATYRRLDFRVLAGDQHPDHVTLSTFRKTHLPALSDLFTEVLRLCIEAQLVAFETLSVDGTKILANASIRANRTEKSLQSERDRLLRQDAQDYMDRADAADAEDDARERERARSKSGTPSPELQDRKSRLEYIDRLIAAQKQLKTTESEAGGESAAPSDAPKTEKPRSRKKKGAQEVTASSAPADKEARINATDSDSRIMRDGATKAYVQGYNAQAVVDGKNQIIVAAAVTQDANDKKQLVPMIRLAMENLGCAPAQVLADAGYYSDKQVTDKALDGIDLFVPPDRACTTEPVAPQETSVHSDPAADGADSGGPVRRGGFIPYMAPLSAADRMRAKLRTTQGRNAYSKRSQSVEPVFGQIKSASGFRQFSFRGHDLVRYEWSLVCMASNLKKLYRATAAKIASRATGVVATPPKVCQNERNVPEMAITMAI